MIFLSCRLDDHVTEINAHTEYDPLFLRNIGIALCHAALNGDRTGDGLDDARELDQHSVAGRLDDPALVSSIFGSISSRRCARSLVRVPASSWPMRRL